MLQTTRPVLGSLRREQMPIRNTDVAFVAIVRDRLPAETLPYTDGGRQLARCVRHRAPTMERALATAVVAQDINCMETCP